MNLIINNLTQDPLEDFIQSIIIPEIQIYFFKNISTDRLKSWDKYFETQYDWGYTLTPPESTLNILIQGINALSIKNSQNFSYTISIDSNKNMPGTTAKLYDLCSLINYGNLEMSPYPIFEDTFKQVGFTIPLLFEEYIENL